MRVRAGSFKSELGPGPCTPCRNEKFTSLPGSVSEADCFCNPGYITNRNDSQCYECEGGLDCSEPFPFHPRVEPGYYQLEVTLSILPEHVHQDEHEQDRDVRTQRWEWNASHYIALPKLAELGRPVGNDTYTRKMTSYDAGITALPVVVECLARDACLGTDPDTGLNLCKKGQHGFLCGACEGHYTRTSPFYSCATCNTYAQSMAAIVVANFVALGFIFGLTFLSQR
ncbi:unnamed protein product [Vitrella brassicaformis CCMP3155]|uniref:Tyrosine-protein kinase ephrin type A/B receptor-like domain-containing protein n=1 Tax=Vitrella brassicaformis (strain CCMP3155) TaxID=1169540 RepID=A0A0G4EB36_VITBC|nr:unnamed protein product [Vitrella brassicaformis CCMP3155]|eukprot:CEL92706.1 unnamed protein product [Vitrella brassicaformis CCMP3155]